MCDGMGWFSDTDYKRMLLIYDEIHYLLPAESVEFEDVDGERRSLLFRHARDQQPFYTPYHFRLDAPSRGAILAAAQADISSDAFSEAARAIPEADRTYTWRVANADAELGGGQSLGLKPADTVLAHALLLNKFLLGADALNAVPITGRAHIHALLSAKWLAAGGAFAMQNRKRSARNEQQRALTVSIVEEFVSPEELARRTIDDILEYKQRNGDAFQAFSYRVRQLVGKLEGIPGTDAFAESVDEVLHGDVWKEKVELEAALRGSWRTLFEDGVKSAASSANVARAGTAVASGLVLGILPGLSLGGLTAATAIAATGPLISWAVQEAIAFRRSRERLDNNGLYYLLHFKND